MAHHIDDDDSCDDDYVDSEEEEEEEENRRDGSGKKRGRSHSDSAARGGKKNKSSGSVFIDDVAEVDEDDEEYEGEEEEDDFLENGETDLPAEEETGHRQRRFHSSVNDDEDDVEKFDNRYFQERYSRLYPEYDDDDEGGHEELTDVDQQALLPSVHDPKLWRVKCGIGREREVAVCLMQKAIDRGSDFKIRSVIALDHLESYIYIEAAMEAHVKEAIKGMRNIYANHKILLVPIREMTDVLSVQSKAIDLPRDTWVRMKLGMYKGDLAQVVDVDNVSRRVTVKLIPRINLQVLANKLEGREIVKKKAFVPPPRFMNIDEARELHIPVEHRRDRMTGDYFENIDGMLFKDGFLYKKVSMKSIAAQNVTPTLDELERLKKPSENGEFDFVDLSTLIANRKKGHFMKGDAVIVIKGDLKNLKGWVEKVDEENVLIRSKMKGLPNPVAVIERELCKYFEPGNLVKVVSGTHLGATGMVVKADQHVLIILSDTTKEHIRVFADHVVKSAEVTNGVTKIVNSFSRFGNFKTPPSPRRFQRGDMGYNSAGAGGRQHWGGRGGRVDDLLVGTYVKVRKGPFKGYRGRLVEVQDKTVRVEHEAKIVTVNRDAISNMTDNEATPSQYNMGSQTPMHPSRTPLHPYMTPMRDSRATPIHDGMRTPMCDRAWNPYTPMSPSRDNWEDGNPGSWGTNLQPRSPYSRAPTPGSGWYCSTPGRNYSDSGTPIDSANAPSPCLPSASSQPMTPSSASYLPSTPGGQPMTPGTDLDVMSPDIGGDAEALFMPGILVNVHKAGEDSNVGVIQDVLPDGSCEVALGDRGEGNTVMATHGEVRIVCPRKNERVKIVGGKYRGSLAKLIGLDGSDGLVKLDDSVDVKILDLAILAKFVHA